MGRFRSVCSRGVPKTNYCRKPLRFVADLFEATSPLLAGGPATAAAWQEDGRSTNLVYIYIPGI